MAAEPDNLVLKMLREMRAVQDEQTLGLKEIRREMASWSETFAQTGGFSLHANIRAQKLEERVEKLEERLTLVEARV